MKPAGWWMTAVFLAGLALGGLGVTVLARREPPEPVLAPSEVRQGQHGLVNPLLECQEGERLRTTVLPFRDRLEGVIDQAVGSRRIFRASVYFRDLIGGPWFAAGSPDAYRIGSLLKVPLLIGFLKRAEADPALLREELRYAGPDAGAGSQNIAPRDPLVAGRSYTIEELLARAIVQSDNEAAALLAAEDGGQSLDMVRRLVEFPPFRDGNLYLTPRHFASMFRILFNASYLTPAASERALALLTRTEFRAGLVAGVPDGTIVAHKFGERIDDGVAKLHDCGIVYHPARPYVLCVMTEGRQFEALAGLIAEVSRVAYEEVGRSAVNRRAAAATP